MIPYHIQDRHRSVNLLFILDARKSFERIEACEINYSRPRSSLVFAEEFYHDRIKNVKALKCKI